MKKTWLIIGAIAVVLVGGLIVWLTLGAKPQSSSTNDSTAVVDKTAEQTVTVEMRNSAFTPRNIKVKKGTTVRWVNQDTVNHNVVALDANDQRELPAENALLGNGESYAYTFDVGGTYQYKCSPHPFMTGSVEVVE
jgi:plastocyanin